MNDGYMIRFHPRGEGDGGWKSVTDGVNGDVRYFKTAEEAHNVKESLELSHREYSYNVYEYDASATN